MALRKYKFVELFIDPATGQPYQGMGSPKTCKTKNFGEFQGHQIAKIIWEKKVVKQKTTAVDKRSGKTVTGPEKENVVMFERLGKKGGWIESMGNLSQGGDCWVEEGGYVCGKAFVSENAVVGGEVGENAKVFGDATVEGSAGVGGNASVYGNAKVVGEKRKAVVGSAKVFGDAKLRGQSIVGGFAEVSGEAELEAQANVGGNAKVLGSAKVKGKAVVGGHAVVYGTVDDNAEVDGFAVIQEGGKVAGNAQVGGGTIVKGEVSGNARILKGQPYIGENGIVTESAEVLDNAQVDAVIKKCSLNGNARLEKGGKVGEESELSGNATVVETGQMDNSKMSGNALLAGQMESSEVGGNGTVEKEARISSTTASVNSIVYSQVQNSHIDGGIVFGSVDQGNITGGVLVAKEGNVTNCKVEGSAVIAGKAVGKLEGNVVVAEGGSIDGTMRGNSRVSAPYKGSISGNGMFVSTNSGDKKDSDEIKFTDNGIVMVAGQTASQNEVFVETDSDKSPEGAAVIVKVEKN